MSDIDSARAAWAVRIVGALRKMHEAAAEVRSLKSKAPRARPTAEPTQLYRHFDADGHLLYVGISLDAITRLSAHKSSGWFDLIHTVKIETFPTRQDALRAEAVAIRTEAPRFNRTVER